MKKFLQVLGLLSLFAWTALGLWAWSAVGDGVTVVVQQGDGPENEAAALLGDRVAALSSDLDALVASLDANFGLLAEALASQSAEQEAQRAVIRSRLDELGRQLPEVLAQLQLLEQHRTAPAPLAAVTAVEVAGTEPEQLEPEPAEPVVESVPQSVESPVARSFLAFRLPSRDFRFEGPQTFEVLGELSRVGFDAVSTLHDFSGVSSRVQGIFQVDLAHPEAGLGGVISIPTGSLVTGVEGRDEAMLEHLESASHARIEFAPTTFEPTRVDAQAQVVEGRVGGAMTIRGVTREVYMQLRAHVDESRRLVLEGEMPLRLSEYSVPVPSQLGVISMDDEVRVWIHLRTRALAGGVQR